MTDTAECKHSTYGHDEAVLHEDGCGRVSMTVEKWNTIERALEAKHVITDEDVREALDAVHSALNKSPQFALDHFATIEARLAEIERLRELVLKSASEYVSYVTDTGLKLVPDDPAFVRVPREVLEGMVADRDGSSGVAEYLLREYGGTE